uniref:uncharacterized protein LOC120337654 n=1 Tax=Styela clava TaxID=7725 RepID=UPI001939ADE5|nr:uncharacterized protein LOC120337654 [Styela clava]
MHFVTNDEVRKGGFYATYVQTRGIIFCNQLDVPNGVSNCTRVGNKPLYSKCDVICDLEFELRGNMTTDCRNGEYTNVPLCIPRSEIIDICISNITDPTCPLPPEILVGYIDQYMPNTMDNHKSYENISALFEELGETVNVFAVITDIPLSRATGNMYNCPNYLCTYNKAKMGFKYNCRLLALKLQKKYNLSKAATKARMIHCFACQSNQCGGPATIFS